jgi:hypothetical protein
VTFKSEIDHLFTPPKEGAVRAQYKRERLFRSYRAAELYARSHAQGRSYITEPANDSQWRVIFQEVRP